MVRMVLISGKAEHGKTAFGDIIKDELREMGFRVTTYPFARYLKFIAQEHFGWNGEKDVAGRELLQWLGTDVVRKSNPDYWANTVVEFAHTFRGTFDYIICDDTRFPNEVTNFGAVGIDVFPIRVVRPGHVSRLTTEQMAHPSETALDGFSGFEYIYNDGNLDALRIEANRLIDKNAFFRVR